MAKQLSHIEESEMINATVDKLYFKDIWINPHAVPSPAMVFGNRKTQMINKASSNWNI